MKPREILKQVKSAIRHPYAWPGGYPVYTVMADGAYMCPLCARIMYQTIASHTIHGENDEWTTIGAEVYWEGPAIACTHCGKLLESAYGDPEEA